MVKNINGTEMAKYSAGELSNIQEFELVRWIDNCPDELIDDFAAGVSCWNDIPLGILIGEIPTTRRTEFDNGKMDF